MKLRHILSATGFLVVGFVFFAPHDAFAATKYWVGGAGANINASNVWHSAAAACGTSGDTTTPTWQDTAVFANDCDNNATVSANWGPGNIDMQTGYTGTVTVSTGVQLEVPSNTGGNVTVTQGTLDASAASFVTIDTTLTIGASGVFTAATGGAGTGDETKVGGLNHTAGGTLNVNTADWVFRNPSSGGVIDVSTSFTFEDVEFNMSNGDMITVASGDTIVATGVLTLTKGGINTGTVETQGGVSVAAGFTGGGTATVNVTTGGTASIAAGAKLPNFNLNNGATVSVSGTGTLTFDNSLTITSGTISMNAVNLTVDTTTSIPAGGTLNLNTGTSDTFTGAVTVSGGTLNTNSATLTILGAFTISSGAFNGGTATITQGDSANVESFTISGGTYTATSGTTTFKDNFVHTGAGTFTHGSGTWVMRANNVASLDVNTSETFGSFTVNPVNGNAVTVTSGDTIVVTGALTVTAGALNTGIVIAQGDVDVDVGCNCTATLSLGGSATQSIDLTDFTGAWDGDVTVNKTGGEANLDSAFVLDAASQDLLVRNGTFDINGQTLTVSGAGGTFVLCGGAAANGCTANDAGTFKLVGSESPTTPTTIQAGSTVEYGGTVGSYTVKDYGYSNLSVTGAATFNMHASGETVNNFTIASGATFGLSGNNLTVNGTFSNDGILTLNGNETTVSLTNDTNSGTVTYSGAVTVTSLKGGNNYYNLSFNNAGGSWTAGAAVDVNGALTITAGTFATGGFAVTLAGNFTNAGTFTHGNGTVTLDGSNQTLDGSTTFYNLTKNVTSAAQLTLDDGDTFTIANNLTWTGQSGQLLTVRSGANDIDANMSVGGTKTVSYLSVRDLNNTGSTIACMTGCTNGGGNAGWAFVSDAILDTITYEDSDADGDVDLISIVYQEDISLVSTVSNILFAFTSTTGANGFGGSLSGNVSIDTGAIIITVTGTDANETGHITIPTLAFTYDGSVTNYLADASGDILPSFGATNVSDAAAPRVKSSAGRVTLDNNNDGTVDFVKLVWTESLSDASVAAGDFCVTDLSGACAGAALAEAFTSTTPSSGNETDTANDATIYVGVSSGDNDIDPNTTDYALYVQVSGTVSDGTNTSSAEGSTTQSTDGAAPIIVSATTGNTQGPNVNRMTINFSEQVDITDASAEDGFDALNLINETSGSCTIDTADVTDPNITLKTFNVTCTTVNNTALLFDPQYATAGSSTIIDEASNEMRNNETVTATDNAEAYPISLTYKDVVSVNGQVDRVDIVFSESLDDGVFTYEAGDWSFTVGSEMNLADTGASLGTTTSANDTVLLTVSGDANETGAATAPTLQYTNQGNADVRDAAGSQTETFNSAYNVSDGAKPRPKTATFYDASSSDGKLDLITVVYTENISAVVSGTADWAVSSAANFSSLVEGTVECNSGAAGANECDYNFTTSTIKTNVGDLTLTYTAGTSVTDGANTANTIALSSSSTPAFTDGAAPAAIDSLISIAGATGTSGAFKVNDTVTVIWNNSSTAGDVSSVTANLSQFGGGASVTMTDTTACGGTASDNIYEACYTMTGSEGIDDASNNVSVSATDAASNNREGTDTSNATVDTIVPTVTTARISVTGASGTSGAFKNGDTAIGRWDNSGTGDNNTDTIVSVTINASAFDDGSASLAGSVASSIYTATVGTLDSQDDLNNNITVTVVDNAGNSTATVGTNNYTVDTVFLTVTVGNIMVTGASGTSGAFKNGDTAVPTWNNTTGGDNNTDTVSSVSFDASPFRTGDSALSGSNSSGTWTASLSGALTSQDDTSNNVTVSATDNAGNVTTTVDTSDYTVDTILPTLSAGNITVLGASGTSGAFKNGDTATARWDDSGTGDDNVDTIVSVSFDGSSFDDGSGSLSGSNASDIWTVAIGTLDSQDDTGNTIAATVTDNAGNVSGPTASTVTYTVDTIVPTVSVGAITVTGASGTSGAFKNGDTAVGRWDNSGTGDNNTDTLASVTIDASAFDNGSGSLSASVDTGIYTATIGALDPQDDTSQNITVTVVDNAGNSTTTADNSNYTVDTIVPVVTAANISVTGASGTSGAFKFGDTAVGRWDNSGTGDNNTDTIASVTINASAFDDGSGSLSPSVDTGIYTATIGTLDSQDDTSQNITVTVVDNAGNSTATADNSNYTVDTIVPVVTAGNISVTGASGTSGAFKFGDTAVPTWVNTVAGDNSGGTNGDISSVSINAANFRTGDTALSASNASNTWTASLSDAMSLQDDLTNNVTVTATDDAGNATSTADTGDYTVDTDIPAVTGANMDATGATGTSGAFKFGDDPTLRWDFTTDGEDDTLASVTFNGANFKLGDTALAGSLSSTRYITLLSGDLDSQDDTGNTFTVTVIDNAGNTSGAVTSTPTYTVDTIVPVVTQASVTVTGASGYSGAFKNGDAQVYTWTPATSGETDTIASVTFDGSLFKSTDTAVAGSLGASIWTATSSLDSQDDTGNTITATVVDDAGNSTGPVLTNGSYVVDSIIPTYVSSTYLDTNANGVIDRVDVVFSEDMSTNFSAESTEWSFPTAGTVALTAPSLDASVTVSTTTVRIVPGSAATDVTGGTAPTFSYADSTGVLTDDVGNQTANLTTQTITDAAAPQIKATGGRITRDNNSDGTVDYMKIVFTESVVDSSVAASDFKIYITTDVVGSLTETFVALTPSAGNETDTTANDATIFLGIASSGETISPNTTDYTLMVQMTGSVSDGVNASSAESSAMASADGAGAILVSANPANGNFHIPAINPFTLTFSEPMATGSFALSPSPALASGSFSYAWDGTNETVTVTPGMYQLGGTVTHTITAPDASAAANAYAGVTYAIKPLIPSSSATSGGGGGGGGGTVGSSQTLNPDGTTQSALAPFLVTSSVALVSPNGGEALSGGAPYTIRWTKSGNVTNVVLYYSVDGGKTYGLIISGVNGTSTSYAWAVPNFPTDKAIVRIVGRDAGGATLAADASNAAFSIAVDTSLPLADAPKAVIATAGDVFLTRPEAEAHLPTVINVDDLVKVADDGDATTDFDSTVYYIGLDAKRHPFPSGHIFLTWYANFDTVRTIDTATLTAIPLGAPVLVRPGTMMVKIQSDARTFAVEPGGYTIRHVPDEATAVALFGPTWNKRILDIEPTYWSRFTMGQVLSGHLHPAGSLLRETTGGTTHYFDGTNKRALSSADTMAANMFQEKYVITAPTATEWITKPAGTVIAGFEDGLLSLQR